jgi:glycosyltransferase involved in cell wall biosynthesis
VDLIMPVYNEGSNIATAVRELAAKVPVAKRLLVVYDFDEDDTLPALRELAPEFPWVQAVKNGRGRGVLNAIRSGIDAATSDVVVVTMADLSDDVSIVPEMVGLIRSGGYDVVCASRYMRGGRQVGGPRLKKFLSRMAGLSLYWLTRIPTHDATNAFRAYRREVLAAIPIESTGGFEYTLELTAKAYAAGYKIGEVPSTWTDRVAGQSRFKLWKWLPKYLKWYGFVLTHRPPRRAGAR